MIVALLLYAYARGVRSSRRIERACIEDVAYRVLAAQQKPDHATLARFVERHQDALAEVFGAVLGLCAKAGLVGVNVVAVDGSKVSANASREATVDYERLAREVLEEAQAVDAEEDERFGDRRGDELPPELATSAGRRQWFREARRWLDDQRAEEAAPIPRDRPKRVKEAKRRMDEQLFTELRAEQAYQRYRASGKDRRGGRLGPNTVPRPYVAAAGPAGHDQHHRSGLAAWSRASTGGCRATTPRPRPTSTRSSSPPRSRSSHPTSGTCERIVTAARGELEAIGITATPGRDRRRLRLLARRADATPRRRRHPGPDPARLRAAHHTAAGLGRRLSTPSCAASSPPSTAPALYKQRQHLIETVFGSIKHNRGCHRFHRRGRAAVRTEWRLITATHNLLKLHKHQLAAAAA